MKHLFFTSVLFFLMSLGVMAQNEKFIKAMEDNLASLKSSTNLNDYRQVANKFERITTTETKEWLPNYWASYLYIIMANTDEDNNNKDQYLDKADIFLKKAVELNPQNDEIMVLKGYIAQSRLRVDPANRWQQYRPEASAAFEKAKELNPENPRIYMLTGRYTFYTPEQFGGGKANACPILKTALEKYARFKPLSAIHPNWGQGSIEELYKQCGE